jgi:M6 family metalloprotease-like protein
VTPSHTHRPRALVRLLAIFLVALFAAGFVAPARAQAAEHKNLVVVVRFSDDATEPYNATYGYNSYYTCWQQFKSWFSPTNIPYFDNGTTSLSSYMSTISNGSYSVTSYFPQSSASYTDANPDNTNTDKTVSGKTVSYITLPHDKSYYESAGDLQLVEDAAVIFNANDAWAAGGSSWGSNGTLENLELVVQVTEEPSTSDTLLWPHKSNASGATSFGGMGVYEYNLVNSKSVGDIGTAKHEYLHSAGLGDLYRVGDTSGAAGPVGVWDIMGSAAGQFPLVQSLVDIGFEDASAIKTISATGTTSVTLHTHYSTAGDGQAVKVYSPYSADEYFVFEYRQKDSETLAPDRLVPSSGLIVYRVNDAVDRDVNGHRTNRNNENGYYEDAIYVFRPGETGIHDSAGNLQMAALNDGSATYSYLGNVANARTTFGSADMTKTITDGAIVDSSDKNSGIVVTVTAQTDDSITFDLAIPDYTASEPLGQRGNRRERHPGRLREHGRRQRRGYLPGVSRQRLHLNHQGSQMERYQLDEPGHRCDRKCRPCAAPMCRVNALLRVFGFWQQPRLCHQKMGRRHHLDAGCERINWGQLCQCPDNCGHRQHALRARRQEQRKSSAL